MEVSSRITCGILFLAAVQSVSGEYRYKIRGPPPKPLPPRPPVPSFASKPFPQTQFLNTKNKWSFSPHINSGQRIIPPVRGSHLQYHHSVPQLQQPYLWSGPIQSNLHGMPLSLHSSVPQFQFKGPSLLLGGSTLPSWKGDSKVNHGFRAPILKEQFLPSPPSQYHPPKVSVPQPPAITHIGNAIDDDKGPIHTIPAPNLSPSSNPNHNHQHETPFSTPVFPQTHVKLEQSHGYEVHEHSNDQAGHTPDGVPTYFAPDPDPSLPAPKIPATTDPHSLPSNGKRPQPALGVPALQILDNSGTLANGLSSQDLFHLLQSPQQPQTQQPLLNSYGVPLVQQPQLQQHFHQQASLFPPANFLKQEEPVQNNLAVFKTEFSPDYQTFNYEEQYQGSSHQQDNYRGEYQEQDESENSPSVTVVRKSPESTVTSFQDQLQNQNAYEPKSNSVSDEDTYYENTATNSENENNPEDYEENHNNSNQNEAESSTSYGGSGALATSYYTTLPNREAAETLATLAAAGNVNSNLINHIRNGEKENVTPNQGDAPVEEDYIEEEVEEVESEDPSPQTSKPAHIQRPKETEVQEATRLSSEHRERRPGVHPAQHQEQIQEDADYVDYSADVDEQGPEHGQETIGNTDSGEKEQNKGNNMKSTNTNLQFGARIRPKRNK